VPEAFKRYALSGWGISLIAGIFLSILSPYGTDHLSVSSRFFFWTVFCLLGAFGAAVFKPAARKLGYSPGPIALAIGQSISASILITIMLAGWNNYRSNKLDPSEILVLFFFVWTISLVITVVAHLAERAVHTEPALPEKEARAPIFERIKPNLRSGEIYGLMAEDHYVRIITSKGDDLILMRLSDAIKELGPINGLPVHRSWWVAEAGVKSVKKSEGKISLELHSGQIVPVSRSNVKSVKQAGWVS